eukprot:COSAG05_NODE_224_length_13609_cov_26.220429_3_plen_85_part_00
MPPRRGAVGRGKQLGDAEHRCGLSSFGGAIGPGGRCRLALCVRTHDAQLYQGGTLLRAWVRRAAPRQVEVDSRSCGWVGSAAER